MALVTKVELRSYRGELIIREKAPIICVEKEPSMLFFVPERGELDI